MQHLPASTKARFLFFFFRESGLIYSNILTWNCTHWHTCSCTEHHETRGVLVNQMWAWILQWHKMQVSQRYKTKGQTLGCFFWLIFLPERRERKLFAPNEIVPQCPNMTAVMWPTWLFLHEQQCHTKPLWRDSYKTVKWLSLDLASALRWTTLGFSKQFRLPGCPCRRQTRLVFQFTCGDFLIIGVLIERRIARASE